MSEQPWKARPEYAVPLAEALERLVIQEDYDAGEGPGPHVHTYCSTAFTLIGAHWPLAALRRLIEQRGVEESGPQASATGHPLCLQDGTGWLFLEAKQKTKEGKNQAEKGCLEG